MMSNRFLWLRPLFIAAGLILLAGSGLMWANADSDVPLVQVSKTVDSEAQKAGETVKFTVTIRNDGSETATLTLVDTMPDHLTLLPNTVDAPPDFIGGVTISESADSDTLTWEGRMFEDGEVVITYEAEIADTAIVDDVLVNEAVVTSSDGTMATASASVTVSRFNDGLPFVFLPMLSWAGVPGLCYQEENRVVVLDITRQEPNGWEYIVDDGAIIEGYYRWPEGHNVLYTQPSGVGLLEYIVRIDNPGRYFMRMHSLTTHPDDGGEGNDIWMRMEGEGWEKVVTWSYQHNQWGWAAGREIYTGSTLEEVQNPPYWDFSTAGEYTFELSTRAGQYGIDRMAFYQSGVLGFNETASFSSAHQSSSSARNEIDNILDDLPTSDLCVGYVPPYFDR